MYYGCLHSHSTSRGRSSVALLAAAQGESLEPQGDAAVSSSFELLLGGLVQLVDLQAVARTRHVSEAGRMGRMLRGADT